MKDPPLSLPRLVAIEKNDCPLPSYQCLHLLSPSSGGFMELNSIIFIKKGVKKYSIRGKIVSLME